MNEGQIQAGKIAYQRTGLKVGDNPKAILTGCILSKIEYFDFCHDDKDKIVVMVEGEEEEYNLNLLEVNK